jgi:O-antigen/teichoic acid export membrane protein
MSIDQRKLREERKLKDVFRKMIKYSSLLVFPVMMGISSLSEPLIRVVLTEKWVNAAWMLQLLCFAGMWYPIQSLNLNILNVKGRSDLFLRLELIKKFFITIVLIVSVPLGLKAMIIGQILTAYLSLVINTHYTKKMLGYGYFQQMRDILMILLVSLVMWIMVFFFIKVLSNDVTRLLWGGLLGSVFYVGTVWIFNIGGFRELLMYFINSKSGKK